MKSKSRIPSSGERAAITGYNAQYRVAASLILPLLAAEELSAIRVADPKAGRVDDLVLKVGDAVRGHQVKWARYGGTMTFRDFTRGSKEEPSLISALADGWKRLRISYPGKQIRVVFATNQTASVNDHVTRRTDGTGPGHFSAFLADAWAPLSQATAVPPQWGGAVASLRKASGLSTDEFAVFVRGLELRFGYQLPGTESSTAEESSRRSDLEGLTLFLISSVADPADVIEITRSELLARLGWSSRLDYRSRHEFPIDEALYEPIGQTASELGSAILRLPAGYVAVLGSPGSGKSSLLTHTLRSRKERVIRYYAYVPDAQGALNLRGESVNFLHDVVLCLERQQFRTTSALINFDRDQLLDRFHKQLHQLHEDWRATGRKTLLLIDGLDHIEREQTPNRSLLKDLPAPEQIPEGVLVLLGSQTERILPPAIQGHISSGGRTIQLQPLSRSAIEIILARPQLALSLTEEDRNRVIERSAGHPLALAYILNYLRADSRPASEVVESIPPYEGNIEALYFRYWSEIAQEYKSVELVALLARIRGALEWQWIETWADGTAVHRVKRIFAHYFRKETAQRWYFFHNSFLLYVLAKTSESVPGVPDPNRDRRLHRKLADLCAGQPATSPWSWDEIYHLVRAEEHLSVVMRATPEYFRSQHLALRRLSAIDADLRMALKSAFVLKDVVALCRIVLTWAEVQQRSFELEGFSVEGALLELQQFDLAISHIRDGTALVASQEFALSASARLQRFGFAIEAKRLFELAEPLTDPSGEIVIGNDLQGQESDRLVAWAEAAVHFRPLEQILDRIGRVRGGEDRMSRRPASEVTADLRARLLYKVGSVLVEERRWQDVEIVLRNVEGLSSLRALMLLRDCWSVFESNGPERSQKYVRRALQVSPEGMPNWARLNLAEGALFVLGDPTMSKAMIEGVEPQELDSSYLATEDSGSWALRTEFRFLRLRYVLGERRSALELYPDAGDARDWGIVYARRALALIAHLWSSAPSDKSVATADVRSIAFPILRMFEGTFPETRDWRSWYAIQSARSTVFELLIGAAGRHGEPALYTLQQLFEAEWETNVDSWPLNVRRRAVMSFFYWMNNLAWAKSQLLKLEGELAAIPDVGTRLQEYNYQISAWVELGDLEAGMRALKEGLSRSFGIGYRKDYQLSDWLEWVRRMNKVSPGTARARAAWYAAAVASLDESTEGKAAAIAAYDLLEITFAWSPHSAISLFEWFREQGVIGHARALERLIQAGLRGDGFSMQIAGMLLRFVLLPISTVSVEDTCELFLERTKAMNGAAACAAAAKALNLGLEAYGFPESRAKNQARVKEALEELQVDAIGIAIPPGYEADLQEIHSSEQYRRGDGTTVLARQLLRQIQTKKDFFALLSEEGADSHFEWGNILERCAFELSADDIRRIMEIRGSKQSPRLLEVLVQQLLRQNEKTAAWNLALDALNASRPYGWNTDYDGGLRMKAFECLIEVDADRARPMAWETLYRDLSEEFRFPGSIARNLLRILPLLDENPPILELWSLVDQHVRSLFPESLAAEDVEARLPEGRPFDTPASAMAELLLRHLDFPCGSVSEASQKCLAEAIRSGAAGTVVAVLPEAPGERLSRRLFVVLDAISDDAPELVRPFEAYVGRYLVYRHFGIRKISRAIWERLGNAISAVPPEQSLPAVYKLVLQPLVDIRDVPVPDGGEPVPDSDDPGVVIQPWEPELRFIASVARLRPENLAHRVLELMREIEPRENWSSNYERSLRSVLASTHLELPFRRPRVEVARRAIYHAVGELVDSRTLGGADVRRLEIALRFHDPGFVERLPSVRPHAVKPMNGIEKHGAISKAWAEEVEKEIATSFSSEVGGLTVLAECSEHKYLSWDCPWEQRCSTFAPASSANDFANSDVYDIFGVVHHRVTKDYEVAWDDEYRDALVARNRAFDFETPGREWCALSPLLGNACGWRPGDGLFDWVDESGNVMVHSLWWVDGLTEHGPPHWTEVGAGWLVLATQEAVRKIASVVGGVVRLVAMERRFLGKDSGRDAGLFPRQKKAFASFAIGGGSGAA